MPLLDGLRVLDLTDDFGLLCGRMLADLGAEVLQVEPPGGARARTRAPFAGEDSHPERSLYWWAYSGGKRSLVLDLATADGQAALLQLIAEADVLIDSCPSADRERFGLVPDVLGQRFPTLIHASITPFGTTGPKASWIGTDLTLWAAGGPLLIQGDDDRPPVRISVPQADLHAATDAVVGVLLAIHARSASGLGQHVDVSVQQSSVAATQAGLLAHHAGDTSLNRMSGGSRNGRLQTRFVYPARDGYVSITHIFGSGAGRLTRKLMEYICEEGGCDEATRDKDWDAYLIKLLSGEEPWEEFDRVKRVIADFTGARTRAELESAAFERGIMLAPIGGIDGVVDNPHFRARGYWFGVEQAAMDRPVLQPGPFARFSKTPMGAPRAAPTLGEASSFSFEGASPKLSPPVTGDRPAPLAGLRVVDLSWVVAGPRITRILKDFGAEVVRIESSRRIDTARTLRPFPDGQPGKSVLFHSLNVGKKMMTLDLRNPAGQAVFLDLVRWADVVVESFSPKAMKQWGLGYDRLAELNPRLIMLSSSFMGQSGPQAGYAGFGNLAAAVSGFYDITGWPDRAPAGPWGAYTDYITPRHGAIALLAALEHRRKTGEGQYIDLCQAEAALQFIAPAILDYTVNRHVHRRCGNDDLIMAPHGVYPVLGEDSWVAIAIDTQSQWETLCELIEAAPPSPLGPMSNAAERRERRADLDVWVASWTRDQDADAVEALLQKIAIPASALRGPAGLSADPQLIHRGHFHPVNDADRGETIIEGNYFQMSETKPHTEGGYPELGRDNHEVLTNLLGYDDDRITQLVIEGAFE